MINKSIFLSPPAMTGREFQYLYEAFHTNWIAPLGANVSAFEREICAYIRAQDGAALSSGTAAIFMGLKALGVGQGDTVFCSDLTFAASCFPITYLGATPVFIDSEEGSCNMSPEALTLAFQKSEKDNRMPKAGVIVDLYGNPADYDRLLPIFAQYDVPVLEDSAEALGSVYHGNKCGTFGKIGAFSFNGNKIITTSGGGMAVSSSTEIIEKIRFWATQSREPVPYYEHREIGYNLRLSNISAGIGRGQLEGLEKKIEKRRDILDYYTAALKRCPVRFIGREENTRPNCWLSVLFLEQGGIAQANRVLSALEAHGIEGRHVWKPMHEQPVFAAVPFVSQGVNGAFSSRLFETGICLPSGDGLTEMQLEQITDIIRDCFA